MQIEVKESQSITRKKKIELSRTTFLQMLRHHVDVYVPDSCTVELPNYFNEIDSEPISIMWESTERK